MPGLFWLAFGRRRGTGAPRGGDFRPLLDAEPAREIDHQTADHRGKDFPLGAGNLADHGLRRLAEEIADAGKGDGPDDGRDAVERHVFQRRYARQPERHGCDIADPVNESEG